jgi:hypothetical protein
MGIAPVLVALLALSPCARAQTQTWVPGKGHGSATIAQQQLLYRHACRFQWPEGFPGTITTNSTFLSFDYGISDRLAVDFSLPWKSSKFEGPGIHDPGSLDDDHGQHLIDDGDYHGGWQDVRVAFATCCRTSPCASCPSSPTAHPRTIT